MASKLIYVVDDEVNIRTIIKQYLINEGFMVESFENGELAFEAFERRVPDMLIIDIMMPVMDGWTLCKKIRKKSDVPIIMVSAKDQEIDKIVGLEIGGDDYISKPFSPREMVQRVKAVFRRVDRSNMVPENITENHELKIKDVTINLKERVVICNGIKVDLTLKEYNMLLFLFENKNIVHSREELIGNIWGYEFYGETRAVDDLIKRIRKKFINCGSTIEIETIWGYGYKVSD